MNPRNVHPLCHMWPSPQTLREARDRGDSKDSQVKDGNEAVRLVRAGYRNKRKAWRQKRRGRK